MEKNFVFHPTGGRPAIYATDEEKKQAKLESKRKWRNLNRDRMLVYNKQRRNTAKTNRNINEANDDNKNNTPNQNVINPINENNTTAREKLEKFMEKTIMECQKIIEEDRIKCSTKYIDEIAILQKAFLPRLILIRGPPGSGKTTYAKHVYSNYEYVSADDYFLKNGKYVFDRTKLADAHLWCKTKTQELLAGKKNVVVANTFRSLTELRAYINTFTKSSNICVLRMTSQYKNIHNVPKTFIDNYYLHYEKYDSKKYVEFDMLAKQIKERNRL